MITQEITEIVRDDLTGEVIKSGGWLLAPVLGQGDSGHSHYQSLVSMLEDQLRNPTICSSDYLVGALAKRGICVLVAPDHDLPLSA